MGNRASPVLHSVLQADLGGILGGFLQDTGRRLPYILQKR